MNHPHEFRIVKDGYGKFIVQSREYMNPWEDTDFSRCEDIVEAEKYIEKEVARIKHIAAMEARILVDKRTFKV